MEEAPQSLCVDCQKRPRRYVATGLCGACYQRAYRASHPGYAAAAFQKYAATHREELQARDRARYQQNRDVMLAKDREYYQRTRDRQRVERLKYYHEHREERRKQRRVYYLRTASRRRAEQKAYYAAHHEQSKAQHRRWLTQNLARVLEYNARRKARMIGAYVAPVDRHAIYDRDKGICGICGTFTPYNEMHIDHIIPLSRGGTHEPANVQVAHAFCNISKHAKLPHEMM